jgi:hypothetical protein
MNAGRRPLSSTSASSPFVWDLEFRDVLARPTSAGANWAQATKLVEPVCFRLEFNLPDRSTNRPAFKIEAESKAGAVEVWLNGQAVALERGAARIEPRQLQPMRNVLAVRVTPEKETPLAPGSKVLSVWLGAFPEVGQLTRELVQDLSVADFKMQQKRAVVCDLCSSLPSGPACVYECPHAAAMRVNALTAFSVG